jgi:hypothetical protein
MIAMTIEEVFSKQKAILLELGFPINPNAELIVFNSVYCKLFTEGHKWVFINSNLTDFEDIRYLCFKGLMHTIASYDDIKADNERVVKPIYKVYTDKGIVYRYCKSKLVINNVYELV